MAVRAGAGGDLVDLHARLVAKRYRHQPIRRIYIPKEQGKTRPIGISAFEDMLAHDAVREVLEAVYEQDFLDCSYGFRPGRSAHDAVRTLDRIVHRGEVSNKRTPLAVGEQGHDAQLPQRIRRPLRG